MFSMAKFSLSLIIIRNGNANMLLALLSAFKEAAYSLLDILRLLKCHGFNNLIYGVSALHINNNILKHCKVRK